MNNVQKIETLSELPDGYKPNESEPFMNELQLEYFRKQLLIWRDQLLQETQETILSLKKEGPAGSDIVDTAAHEMECTVELRARDRERKLINKIDGALSRITNGTYGYCEETGDPIGLRRLEARPIATLSIEAQERHERLEKIQREGIW